MEWVLEAQTEICSAVIDTTFRNKGRKIGRNFVIGYDLIIMAGERLFHYNNNNNFYNHQLVVSLDTIETHQDMAWVRPELDLSCDLCMLERFDRYTAVMENIVEKDWPSKAMFEATGVVSDITKLESVISTVVTVAVEHF